MSEEHLKNKKIGIASTSDRYLYDEEGCGFWYRDVKSAVQGLLAEIENMPTYQIIPKYKGIDFVPKSDVKDLVKKWFSDVVKENNKDKNRCVVCGKLIEEHSIEELEKCVHSLGEPKVLRRIAKEQGWNIKFSEK